MTDYLEELLENTNALLEEVRRTERRWVPSERETQGPSGGYQAGVQGGGMDAVFAGAEAAAAAPGLEARGGRTAVEMSEETEEQRTEETPLLEQVLQMERTAFAVEHASAERQASGVSQAARDRGGYPVSLSGPGGGRIVSAEVEAHGSGWTSGLAAAVGSDTAETDWAERADRVFRRDSRRYDGGFYLY